MRPDLPTGTVTFLFTDIEGSTRLLHALGPSDYAAALARHRAALRAACLANGGVEVDTQGDAFFVAFPTASDAMRAATAATDALQNGPIRVRMGMHTGAPLVTAEGYVGVDVHRGARVAALAHGGQIVVSATTAALIDGAELRDLGAHRLKDFDSGTHVFQLGCGDFPPLRTPGSVDLPSPPTDFLGRERELFDAVSLWVDKEPRVLTIVGPGGTGKTRFSIELARVLAEEADGATIFVPFAPVNESALVGQTIADRLGASSGAPAAIAAAVGSRTTHLVLDNLEHLLPDAATAIAEIVEAAPTLRLLVTSREPLRIRGEVEIDLPPLAEEEAVTLFLERARAVRGETEQTPAVAELCARLDHLPLAVELAAARTKLLSPEQLLDRLTQRLDLLRGTRDSDERHATLRATIAWSYDLLDERERDLFARLSVFAAGCTLDSAEAVCDADLETLGSLLDKSLVRRRTGRLGEERFWMLETIREFAAEQLQASGAASDVRRRHAERMLEIARSAHLSEDDDEIFDLGTALAERDDLRAALDRTAQTDPELALVLAVALENFWNAHVPAEGMSRLGALLEPQPDLPVPLLAAALRVHGGASDLAGDRELAKRRYEESLALYRALDDERGVAALLHRLANSALWRGDNETARRLVEESQALARGRFVLTETTNYFILARLASDGGDVQAATELAQLSADRARETNWVWWYSGMLLELVTLAFERGDLDVAAAQGRDALTLLRQQENRLWAASALIRLASVALARRELEQAGLFWGAAEAHVDRARQSARHETLMNEDDPEFLAARERGKQLDLWDAVAVALGELEPPQTEP
jgi:predicted ATPase